ncbi:MAG: alpha/beta hydrolase [Acidobacteria bacterium]|nr:alpha/beta hydrolase [Acidobacteriota bacterium]
MRKTHLLALHLIAAALALLVHPSAALGQLSDAATSAVHLSTDYRVVADVTYLTANNWDAKLDIYVPASVSAPNPTLIYIHGGGWVLGSKETAVLQILPWLEMGWTVVNVEYRLGKVSLAPAAVEDCRCALRWVIRNAKQYNFDVNKIVLTGHSAGGHLSLTTGMLPSSAGLDRQCPSSFGKPPDPAADQPKVAAIINWFGITDVGDLFDGPSAQGYAIGWFGSLPHREEIAARVSPLTYVRPGLPPILTIHGDADPVVPYSHAVRLHQALEKHGVPNQLLTIPGGKHGSFTRTENEMAYRTIRDFLIQHKIWQPPATSSNPKP